MHKAVKAAAATTAAAAVAALVGTAAAPSTSAASSVGTVRAFPGAEGFGTETPGGRGGRVLAVTTLADSGPGSLRAALEATGPRIVVFRVGGTIELDSKLRIREPFVTVAGQTAPGGGILLKASSRMAKSLMSISTHDVVVRHLRFRAGTGAGTTSEIKGLDVSEAQRVVIDHNSFSWSVDEAGTSYDDTSDVTWSWNVFSEALSRSVHPEGEHSRGFFMSGTASRNITAHHNLTAHNMRRNPEVNTAGTADVRNNVVYDWGTHASQFSDKNGAHTANVVGNFFKKGPSTRGDRYEVDWYPKGPGMKLYLRGNIGPHRTSDSRPEVDVLTPAGRGWYTSTPAPAAAVTTTSAAQAYEDVLAGAGATLPTRDAVDRRIVQEVRTGTGRIIDSPSQVGGWPVIAGGAAPVDVDADGMPDAWERARGLSPTADDSARDRNGDGYTNVEEYINGIGAASAPAPTATPTPTATATPTPTASPTGVPATRLECPPVEAPVVGQTVTCTYR